MKVFISSQTFDIAGHAEIEVLTDDLFPQISRRVSRVATVDGGVAVNDGGYSDGDISFDYSWRTISKAHNNRIARLLKLYTVLVISNPDGVFLVAPDTFSPGASESSIQLLSIKKLS